MSKETKKIGYLRFVITYNIVLLIPLLIVGISIVLILYRQQYAEMMEEAAAAQERQADYLEQQLTVMEAYNLECRYSKLYNRGYGENFHSFYIDIVEDLMRKEEAFPFADGIYYYMKEEGRVISSQGLFTEELFFSNRCRMDVSVFESIQEQEMYAGKAELYGRGDTGAVLVYPLRTWGNTGEYVVNYLLYIIRDSRLREQFGGIPGFPESAVMLSFQEKDLFCSDQAANMRLLTGAGTDGSGLSGGEEYFVCSRQLGGGFASHIYLSRMELKQAIRQLLEVYILWLLLSLVVGSGLALYQSGKKYRTFRSLLDTNEVLQEERNQLGMEKCLHELLSQEVRPLDELWKRCLNYHIHIDRKNLFFAVFPDTEENRELHEVFRVQMGAYSATTAYEVPLVEGLCVYLVCTDESAGQIGSRLESFPQLAVGSITSDVSRIWQSYEDAKKKLRRERNEEDQYPEQEMKALNEAVDTADAARTRILLNELKTVVGEAKEIMGVCITWDVLQLLGRKADDFFGGMTEKEDLLGIFDALIAEQKEERGGAAEKTTPRERASDYKKRNIVDILTYIHEHFLDDNFSVKYMANHFETSVSNLSHFFKKNMQISISAYVEQIKLDRAKALLKESDRKISEIAQMLRYANSTVFIEMFKKYEGITPGNYREMTWKEEK